MSNQRSKFVICMFSLAATCFAQAGRAEDLGHGYSRDGDVIFFEGKRIDQEGVDDIQRFASAVGHKLTLCSKVDAASFEVLNEQYSKDKNKVYYKWVSPGRFWVVELPAADVASFKVINFAHAVDANAIWYLDLPIEGSNPSTVQLIADRIVKDAKSVYVSGQPQPHLDAETFQSVGSAYYSDTNGVYWGDKPIDGADAATFEVLGDSFIAVDQNMVYRSGQRLPHIDPGTCKFILHDPYGYQVISDKNGVYLNKLKFLHADPDDFEMIDERTGRGGKFVFLVDTYHSTPVTVYREGPRLVTETVLYEKGSTNPLAIVKADVSGDKLENIKFSPAPGKAVADPVPDWQISVFQRPNLVKRMRSADQLLSDHDDGPTNR